MTAHIRQWHQAVTGERLKLGDQFKARHDTQGLLDFALKYMGELLDNKAVQVHNDWVDLARELNKAHPDITIGKHYKREL